MASRIKGITIEINGDTTKLSQALRETDTQLTTVQKNLRDVERLLKLDPTNTELLAQKQRLLAEQSALAADRLAQMEDAANHLDSSLSQSQLDDFNLELDLTRARASLAEQELRDFEPAKARSSGQVSFMFRGCPCTSRIFSSGRYFFITPQSSVV